MVQMYSVGVVTWLRDLTQLDLETLTIYIITLHFPATTHTVSHQSTIHVLPHLPDGPPSSCLVHFLKQKKFLDSSKCHQ